MPKITTLEEAYVVEQLRDIYSAENQLVKALPKMAKAATNEDLKAGFTEHLEQTKGHVARLEEIFEELDEKPSGKKCKAMAGLVEEGSETISEDAEPAVKDSLLHCRRPTGRTLRNSGLRNGEDLRAVARTRGCGGAP